MDIGDEAAVAAKVKGLLDALRVSHGGRIRHLADHVDLVRWDFAPSNDAIFGADDGLEPSREIGRAKISAKSSRNAEMYGGNGGGSSGSIYVRIHPLATLGVGGGGGGSSHGSARYH